MRLTMTGIIAKSSNIGTLLAARQMPARKLLPLPALVRPRQPHRHPGLRRAAGHALAAEQLDPRSTRDNIAFGQGLAVNAVQMAAAINTIANGGDYVQPSLLEGRADTQFGEVTGSRPGTTGTGW